MLSKSKRILRMCPTLVTRTSLVSLCIIYLHHMPFLKHLSQLFRLPGPAKRRHWLGLYLWFESAEDWPQDSQAQGNHWRQMSWQAKRWCGLCNWNGITFNIWAVGAHIIWQFHQLGHCNLKSRKFIQYKYKTFCTPLNLKRLFSQRDISQHSEVQTKHY